MNDTIDIAAALAKAPGIALAKDAPDRLRIVHRVLEDRIHVYTSPDMPGLHHAHLDEAEALKTLPAVVAHLVRLQYGVAIEYAYEKMPDAIAASAAPAGIRP